MTLFFHSFLMESKIPEESVRLARLDWVVLNEDWKIVRGFQFHIDPIASEWEMTEDGSICESGESYNRLSVIGHPVKSVLQKFIDDHDACNTAVTVDCDRTFAILIYEAQKAGLRANTHIENRISLGSYTDEFLDLKDGLKPLVDFFVKKCPDSVFMEFNPVSTL